MLGWNRAALPMPFVSPSALLLVDPTDALLSYGVTDAAGIFTHVTPPPNDPAFAGFRAWFQAADLQGADLTQLRLSQGLATALYPF